MKIEEELKKKLKAFMANKSVTQTAKALGISAPYVYDILKGNRPITNPAILRHFGYKKTTKIVKE